MSGKRALYCSYLIYILLVLSAIVEGSPVVTTPKAAGDTTALKVKNATTLEETETPNEKEDATTLKGATDKIEMLKTTFKTQVPTTVKPRVTTTPKSGSPTPTNDRKGHDELKDVTTKNPTTIEKIPFKPSPQILGDSPQNSSVKQTTPKPTTLHNTSTTKDKHVKISQTPPKSHKRPLPMRITRIYRVKSQKGCSSKKEHDVKVHVGEGRYLNIKITED